MRAIASRPRALEAAWVLFTLVNVAAMVRWPHWETVPFHFIWVSMTLLYGARVWPALRTAFTLGAVACGTGVLLLADSLAGTQDWAELTEVPLMSLMFLAMVWHAQRRQRALDAVELQAAAMESLLDRQERFLHDASHELRTPVTIARGQLELMGPLATAQPEISVALDELDRIERILERLLLLAGADRPQVLAPEELDFEPFLEDIFMRWSDVAPRCWRLGPLPSGVLRADRDAVRIALDALLENAVKYTEPEDVIELSALTAGTGVLIEVADEGCGIPEAAAAHVFERFNRADAARNRADGGVGLGLSIVAAVAEAHGGACSLRRRAKGTIFSLQLPGFTRTPLAANAGDDSAEPALLF